MNYRNRLHRLQNSIRGKKLDALIVSQPENRRYISGYRGGDSGISETSGLLFVPSKGAAYILTDSRFTLQAQEESPQSEVYTYTSPLVGILDMVKEFGIKKLGFESSYTLHSFACSLESELTKKKAKLIATEDMVERMRLIKDDDEIEAIRQSVLLNEQVFEKVYNNLLDYETERDIALAIEITMHQMGAESPSFETIVASGERGALPHAIPSDNKLVEGQSLTIDMGLKLDGYCSDMTRTFPFGKPDKKYMEVHRVVRKAQLAGIEAVKVGATGAQVDKAARMIIEESGYGEYFQHSLGHGVGLAVHENPRLAPKNNKKLQAGMIVTVEPGIYIPEWGGIRLEDMVVVREDGCERLNTNDTWLNV